MDAFPSLWRHIDQMIQDGGFLCPDEVLVELERKDDELHRWAKQRPDLFHPLDDDLQVAVAEILATFPTLVNSKRFRSQADPFVIGLARITGRTVVTEEYAGSATNPRIPYVCTHYGIQCIKLLELIRRQGWSF